MLTGVYDWEDISRRLGDNIHKFSKSGINLHGHEISLDQVSRLEKGAVDKLRKYMA